MFLTIEVSAVEEANKAGKISLVCTRPVRREISHGSRVCHPRSKTNIQYTVPLRAPDPRSPSEHAAYRHSARRIEARHELVAFWCSVLLRSNVYTRSSVLLQSQF